MTQKILTYLDSGESIDLLYRQISLSPVPACQCGFCGLPEELQDEDGDRLYKCQTCDRSVPYCYGADDDMYESCDACWCAVRGEEK